MIYTNDEEVNSLVRAFEERTLPKADWTHAAHLTVGLYYCFHHPFGTAKNLMSDGICWLNDAHGTANTDSSGYHETLTVFWLRMIEAFLAVRGTQKSLAALANGLIESAGDTRLPLKHYSRELLFSTAARQKYVESDLENLSPTMSGLTLAPKNFF